MLATTASNKTYRLSAHPGMNIAEVLISLAVFSTAMVGLYMGINSLSQSVQEAMTRDIEAAYANMLLAQVNPYAIDVETAFDQTSRTAITLADGRQAYYTRIVDSDPLAGDIKRISVFLYRQASGGSPYRQFKREVPLNEQNYYLAWNGMAGTKSVYKDTTGKVWTLISTGTAYVSTAGSYQAGFDSTLTSGIPSAINYAGQINNVIDALPWSYLQESNTSPYKIGWRFPATENVSYTVQLGIADAGSNAANERVIDVKINDAQIETIKVREQAGGRFLPLVKSYTVTPAVASGRATISVQVLKNAASWFNEPQVWWISLKKN